MLTAKDFFSISLSIIALVVSLASTAISLHQKRYEIQRTIRQQITDVVGKLNSVFQDAGILWRDYKDIWSEPETLDKRRFLNDQKLFFARQALYLFDQAPGRIADIEYSAVAKAFEHLNDFEKALELYKKAVKAAPEPRYKSQATLSVARMLFDLSRYDEGRETYKQALQILSSNGSSNRDLYETGEALQKWAAVEVAFGFFAEAITHCENARVIYNKITVLRVKELGLASLTAYQKTISFADDTKAKEQNTAITNVNEVPPVRIA